MRVENEEQAQRIIFDWARWEQRRYPQLEAMYHVANEGKRSRRTGADLKRQGMKSGVSDICLPCTSGKYNNLYIELKVGNNTATEEQLEFIDTINAIGGKALVVYGADEAIEVIVAYLEERVDDLETESGTYPKEKGKLTERINKKRFRGYCGTDCRKCENKKCISRKTRDRMVRREVLEEA